MSDYKDIINRVNDALQIYSDKFSNQFHLKIPKNTINKINLYRDNYFPFLKDSVYKSNLCYLLQLVDYQLWLYKVFKPSLSLENAYFYQLLVTLGIITESLCSTILINPLIISQPEDRSMGKSSDENQAILQFINKNSFIKNIFLLEKLNILQSKSIDQIQKIRIDIRNMVHIQNWDGRLYETLNCTLFEFHLKRFRDFIVDLKNEIHMDFTEADLKKQIGFIGENEEYFGTILEYNKERGFGFITCEKLNSNIYFHISDFSEKNIQVKNEMSIKFIVIQTKKGIQAKNIEILNNDATY